MTGSRTRAAIVLCLALMTAALAAVMIPRIKIADSRPKTPLWESIPASFGEWVEDRSVPVVLPAPDVQANLNRVYNQVLARTYVNREGYRIMLSVAYGGDQSDGVNIHRPEICYPAQGFEVGRVWGDRLRVANGIDIPVSRATTHLGSRYEPLTYWIINGERVIARGWDGRMVQLGYTLRGKIPDGMLVRISSIDSNSKRAFETQDRFSRDMVRALDPAFRIRVVGSADI